MEGHLQLVTVWPEEMCLRRTSLSPKPRGLTLEIFQVHWSTRDIRELLRRNEHILEFLARVGLAFGTRQDGRIATLLRLTLLEKERLTQSDCGEDLFRPKAARYCFASFDYAKFVCVARPKIAVMENVPSSLRAAKRS